MAMWLSMFSGSFTISSAGILAYSVYPPSRTSLKPQPFTTTVSPISSDVEEVFTITPDRSIPPINGNFLRIFPLPVAANASL